MMMSALRVDLYCFCSIQSRLCCRRFRGECSANGPVLFVHIVKQYVERFRLNADHFLEVSGYSFGQFLFLFFAPPAIHVNLYDRHKTLLFMIAKLADSAASQI